MALGPLVSYLLWVCWSDGCYGNQKWCSATNYFSDLSLEDYYNKFKGICEELNIYQPISSDVKTMKKQWDSMNIAHFLSRLPKILDPIKSQILDSQDLSSLSEVFGRLRQATLYDDSSTTTFPSSGSDALPSSDKSAFATSMGSNRGGHGSWGHGGHDQEGRGTWNVAFVSALIIIVRIT